MIGREKHKSKMKHLIMHDCVIVTITNICSLFKDIDCERISSLEFDINLLHNQWFRMMLPRLNSFNVVSMMRANRTRKPYNLSSR